MKKVLWAEMRSPEIKQAAMDDGVVIIPVGATEQHGFHLPVNTDANSCYSIAKLAAEAIDEFPVLVLPPIWTGYSPMHLSRPGTISLNLSTLIELLTEVAESVYKNGFKKVFFLSGHGGNIAAMKAMRFILAYEKGFPPSIGLDYFDLPSQPKVPVYEHAGEIETSIQMYLQPQLVDKNSSTWVEGVFGDPSKGTKERGEKMIKDAANDLVEMLKDYHSGKLDDGWGWSGDVMVGREKV